MRNFFEFLRTKGLTPATIDQTVFNWTSTELLDFIAESRAAVPRPPLMPSSIFDFVANSPLSGGAQPCSHLECRLRHADELARYAVLYADRVLIRDPLERYGDITPASDVVRANLAGDLLVLYYLRPLLEKGILGIASQWVILCEEHQKEVTHMEEAFQRKLDKARPLIERKYMKHLKATLKRGDRGPFIELTGADEITEHSPAFVELLECDPVVAKQRDPAKSHTLSQRDLRRFVDFLIKPIMDDIFVQNWYSVMYGLTYLTDRELDIEIMRAVNDRQTNAQGDVLLEALSHSIPFIYDVPLEKLVTLREVEGESFRVYRDALSATLRSVHDLEPTQIREAFQDEIRPQLNRIDLAIKNARNLLTDSMKIEALVAAGSVAIGLFSGLLPPNIGPIIAALGGFQFVSRTLEKLIKSGREPAQIRESSYYFLWKIREAASQKR